MKNTTLIIVVLVIVGIGVYYIFPKDSLDVAPSISAPAVQTATTAPSSVTVNIKNFSFNPSMLTIKAGTKVTWANNDSAPHTITSDLGNLLNSPTLSSGQSFSFTFTAPVTTNYHCNIHQNMKGVVIVTK